MLGRSSRRKAGGSGNLGGLNDLVMVVIVGGFGKRQKLLLLAVNGLTPELQVPVYEMTGVLVDNGVPENKSPLANTRFTPKSKSLVLRIISRRGQITHQ